MTLFLLSIVIASLVAGWVIFPIVFQRWGLLHDEVPATVQERDSRRRVAMAALKDVEYDHAAGKLDDSDYREMRGRLEVEALQTLEPEQPAAPAPAPPAAAVTGPHACGFLNPAGSQFCAGCGQRLA